MKTPYKAKTIYFPLDVLKKLERLAEKEGRGVSNLVVRLIGGRLK